ncbi:MAG: M15 family metallopeptidase [Bacilli bacterium]|nr:M15 family metallopeptidase [Bacilli bacterium]MDD4375574.1 M15 family metallopeptidase [Clostridia bacterium]
MKKRLIYLLIIIISFFIVYKVGDKTNDKIKLQNKGYNKTEISYILDNTSDIEIKAILDVSYSPNVLEILKSKDYIEEKLEDYLQYLKKDIGFENVIYLVNNDIDYNIDLLKQEKYYKQDNLKRYIDYSQKKPLLSSKEVISHVNSMLDYGYYENIKQTDLSKGYLILVNKFYRLDNDYKNKNMLAMNLTYSYTGHSADKLVYDYFKKMVDEALKNDIKIKNKSSYRSYYDQRYIYNNYVLEDGEENANKYSSKPGHSEHQTGLAIDIMTLDTKFIKEDSKEYNWLINNCYKYGFILRYPKNKENLTGYSFEPWHYRYVGIEVATYIYANNITFEEYYEYYIK